MNTKDFIRLGMPARAVGAPAAGFETSSIGIALEDQGFAIVENVLSRYIVDKLVAALEAMGLGNHSRHALRHLIQSVPAVKELAESAVVQALIEPLLGPLAFVARSIFFDKTPEANWKVAWHQDLTITVQERVETEGFTAWSTKEGIIHVQPPALVLERMVTMRLHLDDCGLENGPLQVFPGSHKAGRLDPGQIAAWRALEKPIHCIVPRGGVLLMRPLLLHASTPATRPEHRRVLHLEYASNSLPGGLEWAASLRT